MTTTAAADTTSQQQASAPAAQEQLHQQKPLDPAQERAVRPILSAMTQAGVSWKIVESIAGGHVDVAVDSNPSHALQLACAAMGNGVVRIIQYVPQGRSAAQIDVLEAGAAAPVRLRLHKQGRCAAGSSLMRRWRKADGLMLVFLGPDGAGKSTAIRLIKDGMLKNVFADRKSFHFRTDLVKPAPHAAGGVRNPHGKPPRGLIMSLAKVLMWWTDYSMGYIKEVLPRLRRGSLIIFDRYVFDLLIDRKRYRYGGPVGLLSWLTRSVPGPDLLIVFDAPAEVIQQRKQDISFEETCRQRQAFADLAGRMENSHIVNADQPAEKVARDIENIVVDFLVERARQRIGLPEGRRS